MRRKSQTVDSVGPAERMLVNSMLQTMYAQKGVGLAAPQVGINWRIFVADIGEGSMVFINPRIVKKAGKAVMEEGCLSIPDVHIQVKRADQIWVQFVDENNHRHERSLEGLMARVVQHETDHLNGKMIVDYASSAEIKTFHDTLEKLKIMAREAL